MKQQQQECSSSAKVEISVLWSYWKKIVLPKIKVKKIAKSYEIVKFKWKLETIIYRVNFHGIPGFHWSAASASMKPQWTRLPWLLKSRRSQPMQRTQSTTIPQEDPRGKFRPRRPRRHQCLPPDPPIHSFKLLRKVGHCFKSCHQLNVHDHLNK